MRTDRYKVIVIGGGHAGAEAAWAAANLLPEAEFGPGSVALVTLDPAKIGVMSCNPAIGGLAKGQLVREIDAMGGLMGLAADATGIHFKMLNTSKGPAVRGPRCQNDKHAYAEEVQRLVASRPVIKVVPGAVETIETVRTGDAVRCTGVGVRTADGQRVLSAPTVVLTTGTFMRGLMHTGETKTSGGRHGESAASAVSAALTDLGFELGRLKTGTPPRVRMGSIAWDALPEQPGDDEPVPFSDMTDRSRFPAIDQVVCRQTRTAPEAHAVIRENLHRAPMYSGEIDSTGPRYCPSIEDKVVKFAER
ncbi:MAG: FAD-dependent oxidoreductase, partial [Planctomycetota bacterium]